MFNLIAVCRIIGDQQKFKPELDPPQSRGYDLHCMNAFLSMMLYGHFMAPC